MIEKYFQNLNKINDIEAFVLMDANNRIIGKWISSKYDTSIFTEIGKSYLQIFGIEEEVKQEKERLMTVAKESVEVPGETESVTNPGYSY